MWLVLARACPVLALVALACLPPYGGVPSATGTPPPPKKNRAARDTVVIKDPDTEQRAMRLQLRLLEREAEIADLEARLDDARREVVRAMAKLQTLASRAEAASGMAEAEIALDSLKAAAGQQPIAEIAQVTQLLQMSTTEFDNQNYGGALYLANQAKAVATAGQGRLTSGGEERGTVRAGEVAFAHPLPLQAVARGNVREGPGTGFRVVFTVDQGAPLTGYAYADVWVRVSADSGKAGWIVANLVGKRQPATN